MAATSTLLEQTFKKAKALHQRRKFAESNGVIEPVLQTTYGGDKVAWAEMLLMAGDNNFQLGNYQLSLQQFLEAEKIFKELKLIEQLAQAENNLGAAYKRLGLPSHSLFKNLEALTYSFQTHEEFVMTSSLMNAATSLFDTGHTEKAFRALDTAILVCDKNSGNERYEEMRIVILNNKATFCIGLKRIEEALTLLQQASETAARYSFANKFIFLDSNISNCLVMLNRVDEGLRLLEAVIRKRKNVHDDHYVADLVKLGLIYKTHFKNDQKFLGCCDKALKLAENKNLAIRQIFINQLLKDYYTGVKNQPQAQRFEKKLQALEEQYNQNKQTGGMEKLFDTNVLAIENMLSEKEKKPEFLNRYDHLIGNYAYAQYGVTRRVLLRDIAFCEVRGNYLFIHTFIKNEAGKMVLEEGHKLRKTMKEFVEEINTSEAAFARIHNSFIVNLCWLSRDSVKGGDSIIVGNRELNISDTYRSAFKKKLSAFFESELILQ